MAPILLIFLRILTDHNSYNKISGLTNIYERGLQPR